MKPLLVLFALAGTALLMRVYIHPSRVVAEPAEAAAIVAAPAVPVASAQPPAVRQDARIAAFESRQAAGRAEYLALVNRPRAAFEEETPEEREQFDRLAARQRELVAQFRSDLGPDGWRRYQYEKRHRDQGRVVAELEGLGMSREDSELLFRRSVEQARIERDLRGHYSTPAGR